LRDIHICTFMIEFFIMIFNSMVAWHLLSYTYCDCISLHGLTPIGIHKVILKFASVIDVLFNEVISRELIRLWSFVITYRGVDVLRGFHKLYLHAV